MFWLLYHDLDARTPKSLVLLDFAQLGKLTSSYLHGLSGGPVSSLESQVKHVGKLSSLPA
jgi:hypothetical protein